MPCCMPRQDQLRGAGRYERSEAGYLGWQLRADAADQCRRDQSQVPKLRRQTFETAIIERYRRRESSVEEALIEMYLAGNSGQPGGRHYRSAVEHAGEPEHGVQPERENLRHDRGLAESAHRR